MAPDDSPQQELEKQADSAARTYAGIDLVSKIFIGLVLLSLAVYVIGGQLGFWKDPTL